MAETQVQLKREEIVGGEVVLNDIDPKTTTNSVIDTASGLELDESLMRIWNAINNKLSRIVNSVNGRTGVLVLSPEDIGLGKVDNVSFADIQKWVIEQLKREFDARTFKLYNSLDDLDADLELNDKSLSGTGFFAKLGRISNNDKLSYIGYIKLDEGTDRLTAHYFAMNVVGYTDHSILYNEKAGDRNLTLGGIGVNIAADEDALIISETLTDDPEEPKKKSGLKILKEKITPNIKYFKGVYGNIDEPGGEDAWLHIGTDVIDPTTSIEVKIIYNGDQIAKERAVYSKISDIKLKDIIICDFSMDYIKNTGTEELPVRDIPNGMEPDLLGLHSAIGVITEINKRTNGSILNYTVDFHPVVPRVGYGLQYYGAHNAGSYFKPRNISQLTPKVARGAYSYLVFDGREDRPIIWDGNVSGICLRAGEEERRAKDFNDYIEPYKYDRMTYTVLPQGPTQTFGPHRMSEGGMMILPDCSLCVLPVEGYLQTNMNPPYTGGLVARNWLPAADFYTGQNPEIEKSQASSLEYDSMLSVNLNKVVINRNKNEGGEHQLFDFSNISGLKILNPEAFNPITIGYDNDTHHDVPTALLGNNTSGGLMINCGPFMKIQLSDIDMEAKNYYDGGKLTINVGDGLYDNGNGKLSVNTGQGLEIKQNADGESSVNIALARQGGLEFVTYGGQTDHPYDVLKLKMAQRNTAMHIGPCLVEDEDGTLIADYALGVITGEGLKISDENKLQVNYEKQVYDSEGTLVDTIKGGLYINDDILAINLDNGDKPNALAINPITGGLFINNKKLIIEQGNVKEEYDGTSSQTITIGRGLRLVPTPTTSQP